MRGLILLLAAVALLLCSCAALEDELDSNRMLASKKKKVRRTKSPTARPSESPSIVPNRAATNFIIMFADDLGYGDLEHTGGAAATTNITAMANSPNSFQFTNYHSGSSVCSPSRASLLTGRIPERDCVLGANSKNRFPIRGAVSTIAHDANSAGYRTGFFGKWHLGPFTIRSPATKGFQTWVASENNMPTFDAPCFCDESKCLSTKCSNRLMCSKKPCRAKKTCYTGFLKRLDQFHDKWECQMTSMASPSSIVQTDVMPGNKMSSIYLAEQFTAFVKDTPANTPLLAVVAFHEPHMPYIADPAKRLACETDDNVCHSDRKSFPTESRNSHYFGVISSVDDAVGMIRKALSDTGRLQNSFLIFTSDNGPEDPQRGGAGSAAPFRGRKRALLEGGHRVPAVLYLPKYIKQNRIISTLVSSLDLRPTIRDILRLENPGLGPLLSEDIDGESWMNLFHNKDWIRTKPFALCHPISTRDKLKKLCKTLAYYDGSLKIIVPKNKELNPKRARLYNVTADMTENVNLAMRDKSLTREIGAKAKAFRVRVMQDFNRNCKNIK